MKYKLLVLDVDGTLLNNERQISKRNLSALLKVQQAGVRIVLASGRPTYGILHLAKALELGNYGGFVISYNGCQIIKAENGEIIFERRINPELIPYLEKKARKNGFDIFTYHDNTILASNPDNPHIRQEAELNSLQIIKEEEFSAAIDFSPCKVMLVSDDYEALGGLENHWKKRLAGTLDVFPSEPFSLLEYFEAQPEQISEYLADEEFAVERGSIYISNGHADAVYRGKAGDVIQFSDDPETSSTGGESGGDVLAQGAEIGGVRYAFSAKTVPDGATVESEEGVILC